MAPNVVSARLDDPCFDHIFWMPDCGNVTTAGSTKAPDNDCKTQCIGDSSELCGGPNSLSLYGSNRPPQPDPVVVVNVGEWRLEGCYR